MGRPYFSEVSSVDRKHTLILMLDLASFINSYLKKIRKIVFHFAK